MSEHRTERFVPIERREMRGVAFTTIMMFAVPVISIITLAVKLTGMIENNSEDIKKLETKIEVLNTKIETHTIRHSDCEKWRAVMEEKIKHFVK